MDPIKLTEYTKKYGSSFLMWCAIAFLYTELASTKGELKEIQSKLFTCLELRANHAKNYSDNQIRFKNFAVLPKKQRYGIEKEMEC